MLFGFKGWFVKKIGYLTSNPRCFVTFFYKQNKVENPTIVSRGEGIKIFSILPITTKKIPNATI